MMRNTNVDVAKPSIFKDNARKASLDVRTKNNGLNDVVKPPMTEPKSI